MMKSLMIQGTCSGAGKSLLVAGLLRILSDMGINAAPFKSQNMALNSFVTEDGSEIGRAQALQAEAARMKPIPEINPILLKALGDKGCQVIVNGRVHANMSAKEYYAFKDEAWLAASGAYDRLKEKCEAVVIEGAGSPAEINLIKEEIVNMRVARYSNSPVLLVGDIDRGGVFASFYGTVGLLDGDAEYIKAFVINKFRGDKDILSPGLKSIEQKTGIPVVGVVPWVRDLGLDEEDGMSIHHFASSSMGPSLRIVVVRLPYISNFTDFDSFRLEPDVELIYSTNPDDIENADLLIVPGSKNTVKDLMYLREAGIDLSIKRAAEKGVQVAGICGGYQMLGKKIIDPFRVESQMEEVDGMGLLDVVTELKGEKTTTQSEAETSMFGLGCKLRGYEIHMGETLGDTGLFKLNRLASGEAVDDGSMKGNVWGTYLHGLFDNDGFRLALLNALRKRKGLELYDSTVDYSKARDDSMNRWAALLRESIDMDFVMGLIRG
jgi:adenosylcobyric acid synthase